MVYITDGMNIARVSIQRNNPEILTSRDETNKFIPCEDEIVTEAYFKDKKIYAIHTDDLESFLNHVWESVRKESKIRGNEYKIETYKIHTIA